MFESQRQANATKVPMLQAFHGMFRLYAVGHVWCGSARDKGMQRSGWPIQGILGILLALACATARAEIGDTPATICTRAARKVDSFIVDWHDYVVQFKAQGKNQSVLAMFAEHRRGVLKANFRRHCLATWAKYDDIFTCFAGTTSELGAALCRQTDTNRNDWQYRIP